MAGPLRVSTRVGSVSAIMPTIWLTAPLKVSEFSPIRVVMPWMPSISFRATPSPMALMSSGWKPSDRAALMSDTIWVSCWAAWPAMGKRSASICRFTPARASVRLSYLT